MAIKFGELRKYLSIVIKIFMCSGGNYCDNYKDEHEIPEEKYDDMYVLGISMVEDEIQPACTYIENIFDGAAIKVDIQEEPVDFECLNDNELLFGDLRNYLKEDAKYIIVRKEDFKEENYQARKYIPQCYDNMYVHIIGLGIDGNTIETIMLARTGMIYSYLTKVLKIIVSKSPRKQF